MAPKLYTSVEAREILRIGKTRMYTLMTTGEIPSFKVGPHRRILAEDLDAYLARLKTTAHAA